MNIFVEYLKSIHRIIGVVNPGIKEERKKFFRLHAQMDYYSIPIFIISYNRLSYLTKLISRLENMGYKNIKIIDNASTYPPLLDFYSTTEYEVFRLNENYGHMAFWKNDIFAEYRNDLYAVTDPDVIPIDKCPNDFMEMFCKNLENYPRVKKVGFSLKIDDIPKNAPLYNKVMQWEKIYNFFKIPYRNAFCADIDTTFALYIPDYLDISRHFITAIRIGNPYQARHLPWYKTEIDIDEEEMYYASHRTNGWWDINTGTMTEEGTSSGWIKGQSD